MNAQLTEALAHRTILAFEGAAVSNGVPVSAIIGAKGAKQLTIRCKTQVNGTLIVRFLRPDKVTEYATNQPSDTVIAAAPSEQRIQVTDCEGVTHIKVQFTPSANGTFNFLDVAYLYQ